MLYYTMPESFASEKHSSLLYPFDSYEENEVLWMQFQGSYSQHFIFFIAYKWTQYTRPERLASEKPSSLLDPFDSYEENEVL